MRSVLRFVAVSTLIFLASTGFIRVVQAQNPRGSATGPTTAKGYDHPGQYLHVQDVKPADNMYPVVQHPEQDAEARQKLAALEKRFGKKPNILIFLMDDVGYMDPGFNGGGAQFGVLHTILLSKSCDDHDRAESLASRHSAPADVR